MAHDLELVPTDALAEEIFRRHDVTIITTAQYKQGHPAVTKWISGHSLEVLGLLELTRYEALTELYADSVEEDR